MRAEARSLDALLSVVSQRIVDSRSELSTMAQQLMRLGDEATDKLGGLTRQFDSSSERLARHGSALDLAAESARTDIAVLLDDLPRAESAARAVSEQLRAIGSDSPRRPANSSSRSRHWPSGPEQANRASTQPLSG